MMNVTQAQLDGWEYKSTPFADGIISEDYRARFADEGESLRHWHAFTDAPEEMLGPNGETPNRDSALYIENVLPPDVRVLIQQTEREVTDTEFGQFAIGQTSIACIPDELELARYDRVLLIERRMLKRESYARASGSERDLLGRSWVAEIVDVWNGAQKFGANDYELEVEDDGSSFLKWKVAPPPLVRVNFRFMPQYVFLDVSDRNPPRGADQLRLPQRGILTLENRKS